MEYVSSLIICEVKQNGVNLCGHTKDGLFQKASTWNYLTCTNSLHLALLVYFHSEIHLPKYTNRNLSPNEIHVGPIDLILRI